MKRIVSFTAPSGCGKTTLAKELLNIVPGSCMIESYTTRTRRPSDIQGEYRYVTFHQFENFKRDGAFLWTASHGDNYYGTMSQSIRSFVESSMTLGIMILTPESVPLLAQFINAIGKGGCHTPIFITPPPREVLENRLRARGDTEESIKVRLTMSDSWEDVARHSSVSYIYITNDTTIASAASKLVKILPSWP